MSLPVPPTSAVTDSTRQFAPGSTADSQRAAWERVARSDLPGRAAQRRFEPAWGFGRHFGAPPHDAVAAAVVLVVYPHEGRLHVPLTLRPATLSAHGGQISLPGGRLEPGESDLAAALRELREELSVAADEVVPLARLTSLYIFGTNFHVRPWLVWAERRPDFRPNPTEVEALLEVPLEHLVEAGNVGRRTLRIRGVQQEVPHIVWRDRSIWGATAMILGEATELYRRMIATTEPPP